MTPGQPHLRRSERAVPYFIERLESAGLVSLVLHDEDRDEYVRVLLWPDKADVLADELKAAAKDVRDV